MVSGKWQALTSYRWRLGVRKSREAWKENRGKMKAQNPDNPDAPDAPDAAECRLGMGVSFGGEKQQNNNNTVPIGSRGNGKVENS